MNFRLPSNREMAQKNGSIHRRDSYIRMLNRYQSLGRHLRSPQDMWQRHQNYPSPNNSIQGTNLMLQGHQNYPNPNNSIQGTNLMLQGHQHYPSPNNFIQGNYHENNIVDAKTQPMVPLPSPSNNNASLMSAARYGGMSLLALPRDPPVNMGSSNIPLSLPSHVDSFGNSSVNNTVGLHGVGNSSFNNVGLQGYTNGFPNASKTTFGNHNNLPYRLFDTNNSLYPIHNMNNSSVFKDFDPYPSHDHMNNSSVFQDYNPNPSHHINDSSVFQDFNPNPMVDMNSFHSVKDVDMPCPLPPTHTQTVDPFILYGDFNDLTRERAMKRPLCEVQGTDIIASASKMPRMSSTPPDFYEEKETEDEKVLLLFKDGENPFSASEIMIDAKEEDEENMDLLLHL